MTIFDPAIERLPEKDFVVISPYLVDPRTTKKVNVGDGFIMDSALKLIGAKPACVISSRMPITLADLERINGSKLVLVAGANTLKSNFEITPNFTPALFDQIRVPVVLCGIGHYGVASATSQPLDRPSDAIMREVLRRFPYISLRCDASVQYLTSSIPDLADRVLMTSCPVVYAVDGLDGGFEEKGDYDQLVVTVTDRHEIDRQLNLLRAANTLFKAKRRVLALHQDYTNGPLWSAAKNLGYEIFISEHYSDFIELYKHSDIHFGNRLHAHLKSLSLGKRSFLTPFDLRQSYFAESLDFPLITALSSPEIASYDFGRAKARVTHATEQMTRFIKAVRLVLEGESLLAP